MIYSEIAKSIGVPPDVVRNIANGASHRYKIYTIPKRTQGRRTIAHPAKELKVLQRWLVDVVFPTLTIHDCALGYREGVGIRDVVLRHAQSRFHLRLDYESFFESISALDIKKLLVKHWNALPIYLPKADVERIVKIVVRHGQLTIGAPSSPVLSNAVLYEIDRRIADECKKRNCVYSRYADDLFFSTNEPNVLEKVERRVSRILEDSASPKLKLNTKKIFHSSRKNRVRFLGLIVTPTGEVSVGRSKKKMIRALIHRYQTGDILPDDAIYLSGYLAFIKAVEPNLLKSLERKYSPELIHRIKST